MRLAFWALDQSDSFYEHTGSAAVRAASGFGAAAALFGSPSAAAYAQASAQTFEQLAAAHLASVSPSSSAPPTSAAAASSSASSAAARSPNSASGSGGDGKTNLWTHLLSSELGLSEAQMDAVRRKRDLIEADATQWVHTREVLRSLATDVKEQLATTSHIMQSLRRELTPDQWRASNWPSLATHSLWSRYHCFARSSDPPPRPPNSHNQQTLSLPPVTLPLLVFLVLSCLLLLL